MSDLIWTPVKIRLGQIIPWSENPRMSTKSQAQRLIKSERELGQIQTLAVSPFTGDNRVNLYDGHQRCAAWMTVKDPSFEVTALQSNRPLTDDERRKVSVLLHTATGSWDWNALSAWSAADLREWGMDKDTLKGWQSDAKELTELLNSEHAESADAEPQIDRAAELAEKWQTASGQLWKLGEHRLLIDDCTVRENVERLMGGERAGACITDPPWNVGWKYDKYKDDLTPEQYKIFSDKWRENSEFAGCELFFVALSMKNYKYFNFWFPMAERVFAECQNFVQHTGGFMQYAFNPILVWGRSDIEAEAGKRDFYIAQTSNTKSTPDKELAKINTATRWLPTIEYICSFASGIIYEPFCGTGTTIIAAHNLNRRCYAMEISEKYGAVILERFYTATGITPELVE